MYVGLDLTTRGALEIKTGIMDKLILDEAQQIWKEIAQHKKPGALELEIDLYKKLLNIFQVGAYYYMIFNPPEMKMEFVSESITNVLGYTAEEFTLDFLVHCIHPDDRAEFVNFEATVTEFWKNLPPDRVMKYKTRYDYRVRRKNGTYIRVLQQVVTIQSDKEGAVLRTFVVHTDITHLKQTEKMTLSFIGLEGEPSYLDVQPIRKLKPAREVLTPREKEIFQMVVQRMTTVQIADVLHISPATVSTHRKNIQRKTRTGSILELVKLGLKEGWI